MHMVKQKADDVKKEVEEQEDEFYGDATISGTAPDPSSDDDVDEVVKEVTGEKPEQFEPVGIAEEVDEDEKALHTKPEGEEESEE
jgi:hypothetical protein